MTNSTYIILYIAGGVVLLSVLIWYIVTFRKRKRLKLLTKVRMAYGSVPKREYTAEELKKIGTYFEHVRPENGYFVDDITWNDLDMDSIFIAMNHTFSSVGEEVLYDILREPVFSREELEERDRLIRFFTENDRTREEIWMDYAAIGRTRKFSLVQFLGQFRELELKDNISHLAHVFACAVAFGVIFVKPAFGVLALIGVLVVNIATYFSDKGAVEPYYVSLSAMAYLVRSAEKIAAHDVPELKKYTDIMKEEAAPLRGLVRDMKWLGSGTVIGTGGDLGQMLMDYLRMSTHLDFVYFNHMVRMVRNNEDHIMKLIRCMGYLEAMISVSSYRRTIPFSCTADLENSKKTELRMKDGYHPLIKSPVANSISEEVPVLVTGSNASGKSTFLRTTALAALMAQTVNTVHAHAYSGSFYRIYSSMALRDSVESGESYYMAEIRSIKRILDALEGEAPVLMFVDEVLRGTNTVERIAASSEILRFFAEHGAMTFAATHDIELTHLLDNMYKNYHFDEEIVDREVHFNYILKKGRAESRNAIRLLDVMGYDEEVTARAEKTAEHFMKEGTWEFS